VKGSTTLDLSHQSTSTILPALVVIMSITLTTPASECISIPVRFLHPEMSCSSFSDFLEEYSFDAGLSCIHRNSLLAAEEEFREVKTTDPYDPAFSGAESRGFNTSLFQIGFNVTPDLAKPLCELVVDPVNDPRFSERFLNSLARTKWWSKVRTIIVKSMTVACADTFRGAQIDRLVYDCKPCSLMYYLIARCESIEYLSITAEEFTTLKSGYAIAPVTWEDFTELYFDSVYNAFEGVYKVIRSSRKTRVDALKVKCSEYIDSLQFCVDLTRLDTLDADFSTSSVGVPVNSEGSDSYRRNMATTYVREVVFPNIKRFISNRLPVRYSSVEKNFDNLVLFVPRLGFSGYGVRDMNVLKGLYPKTKIVLLPGLASPQLELSGMNYVSPDLFVVRNELVINLEPLENELVDGLFVRRARIKLVIEGKPYVTYITVYVSKKVK